LKSLSHRLYAITALKVLGIRHVFGYHDSTDVMTLENNIGKAPRTSSHRDWIVYNSQEKIEQKYIVHKRDIPMLRSHSSRVLKVKVYAAQKTANVSNTTIVNVANPIVIEMVKQKYTCNISRKDVVVMLVSAATSSAI
jgi:hypothetical protein